MTLPHQRVIEMVSGSLFTLLSCVPILTYGHFVTDGDLGRGYNQSIGYHAYEYLGDDRKSTLTHRDGDDDIHEKKRKLNFDPGYYSLNAIEKRAREFYSHSHSYDHGHPRQRRGTKDWSWSDMWRGGKNAAREPYTGLGPAPVTATPSEIPDAENSHAIVLLQRESDRTPQLMAMIGDECDSPRLEQLTVSFVREGVFVHSDQPGALPVLKGTSVGQRVEQRQIVRGWESELTLNGEPPYARKQMQVHAFTPRLGKKLDLGSKDESFIGLRPGRFLQQILSGLDQPLLGLAVGDKHDAAADTEAEPLPGQLSIGRRMEEKIHADSLRWVDVVGDNGLWEFDMNSIRIDGVRSTMKQKNKYRTIVDTDSHTLYLPHKVVEKFYQKYKKLEPRLLMGHTMNEEVPGLGYLVIQEEDTVAPKDPPDLTWTAEGGIEMTIPGRHLLRRAEGRHGRPAYYCGVVPSSTASEKHGRTREHPMTGYDVILSLPALYSVYVEFWYEETLTGMRAKLGFARRSNHM